MSENSNTVDLLTLRRGLTGYISNLSSTGSIVVTRYGKPIATLSPFDTGATGGTTSRDMSQVSHQVEHIAVAPSERPLNEPLEVTGSQPNAQVTAQQRRDAILHGVTTPPRPKR